MRYVVVLALAVLGCASVPVKEATQPRPDMDGVLRVIGRFSTAHACPFGDGQYALTAAHVIDPRPFDLNVPAYAVRWSDGDGHSGVAEPVVVFRSSDLAVLEREDRKPFARSYPIAQKPPLAGDRIFVLAYDQESKGTALAPNLIEGKVLRVVADNLILDENSNPGSSGGCVLNERGEIVGIVAWGRQMPDGVIGITVGVWTGIAELEKFATLLKPKGE